MKIVESLVSLFVCHNVIGLCDNRLSYFERAVQSPYFVDKTKLLRYFLHNDRLPLTTLPKSFGKSTNLDMIRQFFQIPVDKSTGERIDKKTTRYWQLFTNKSLNLQISRDQNFVEEHFGKYPVIYLSFTNIQGTSDDEIMDSIGKQIYHLFASYRWLFELAKKNITGNNLQPHVKRCEDVLCQSADLSKVNIFISLVKVLAEHFQNNVMVLIDDYDRPTLLALNNFANAKRIDEYIHSILGWFVNENRLVSHVMVLGRCRLFIKEHSYPIPMDSINYDYFLQHAKGLGDYFGFTEDEIDGLFAKKSIVDRKLVREYFDGYAFKVNEWENVTKLPLYYPQGVLRYLQNNTLQNDDFTTDDSLVLKILKCLRHQIFFIDISYLLLDQSLVYHFQGPHMSDTDLLIFAQMIHENCSHYNQEMPYAKVFLDHGYLAWNGTNTVKVANKFVLNQLKKHVQNFYYQTYGINVTDSYAANSIGSILTSNTTTKHMLAKLTDSLQRLIDQNKDCRLTAFEFQSIIFGVLYSNFESYQRVDVKEVDKTWIKTFRGLDTLRLSNHDQSILLIIHTIIDGKVDDAVLEARKYIPCEPQTVSSYNSVKYLGINLNESQQIETAIGESRNDW